MVYDEDECFQKKSLQGFYDREITKLMRLNKKTTNK